MLVLEGKIAELPNEAIKYAHFTDIRYCKVKCVLNILAYVLTLVIFLSKVDVIVNTTSRNLDMTRGAVSKAILEAAGDELKNEIAKTPVIKQGSQRIRVEYGDIVETFGYRLKCQRIFHGTLYKWTDDQSKSLDVGAKIYIHIPHFICM